MYMQSGVGYPPSSCTSTEWLSSVCWALVWASWHVRRLPAWCVFFFEKMSVPRSHFSLDRGTIGICHGQNKGFCSTRTMVFESNLFVWLGHTIGLVRCTVHAVVTLEHSCFRSCILSRPQVSKPVPGQPLVLCILVFFLSLTHLILLIS